MHNSSHNNSSAPSSPHNLPSSSSPSSPPRTPSSSPSSASQPNIKRKDGPSTSLANDDDVLPPPSKVARHLNEADISTQTRDYSVKNLPSEILLMIATFLVRKDVAQCILACKNWQHVLCLYIWTEIGRDQWMNPLFPLVDGKIDDDVSFDHRRRQVRKLEWSENDNLNLSSEKMATMLPLMPGLKKLSLTAAVFQAPRTLLSVLRNHRLLTMVTSMDLHLRQFDGEDALLVREVVKGCEDLEHLGISGTWFRDETQQEIKAHPGFWKIQSLSVPRTHLGLLNRCPDLLVLALTSNLTNEVETDIRPIAQCLKLERLKFVGRVGFAVDGFAAVLPQMHCLTLLVIEHIQQDRFGQLEGLRDIKNAPGLKGFELGRVATPVQAQELLTEVNQAMVISILRARPDLTNFKLKGYTIDAFRFFTLEENDESMPSCPCPRVRELWLEIHGALGVVSTDIMQRDLKLTYKEVSRIKCLQSLTLKSIKLDVSNTGGLHFLTNATKLKELRLSNPLGHVWSLSEMTNLMEVVPGLQILDLMPLTRRDRGKVNKYLRDRGKGFLCF